MPPTCNSLLKSLSLRHAFFINLHHVTLSSQVSARLQMLLSATGACLLWCAQLVDAFLKSKAGGSAPNGKLVCWNISACGARGRQRRCLRSCWGRRTAQPRAWAARCTCTSARTTSSAASASWASRRASPRLGLLHCRTVRSLYHGRQCQDKVCLFRIVGEQASIAAPRVAALQGCAVSLPWQAMSGQSLFVPHSCCQNLTAPLRVHAVRGVLGGSTWCWHANQLIGSPALTTLSTCQPCEHACDAQRAGASGSVG
jgi:hypothetical protein